MRFVNYTYLFYIFTIVIRKGRFNTHTQAHAHWHPEQEFSSNTLGSQDLALFPTLLPAHISWPFYRFALINNSSHNASHASHFLPSSSIFLAHSLITQTAAVPCPTKSSDPLILSHFPVPWPPDIPFPSLPNFNSSSNYYHCSTYHDLSSFAPPSLHFLGKTTNQVKSSPQPMPHVPSYISEYSWRKRHKTSFCFHSNPQSHVYCNQAIILYILTLSFTLL